MYLFIKKTPKKLTFYNVSELFGKNKRLQINSKWSKCEQALKFSEDPRSELLTHTQRLTSRP